MMSYYTSMQSSFDAFLTPALNRIVAIFIMETAKSEGHMIELIWHFETPPKIEAASPCS